MTNPQQDAEIRAALAAAEQVPGFTFLPAGASEAVIAALKSHASATGKEVLAAPAPGHVEKLAAAHAARDAPVIARGDHRGFLKNVEAIARGDAKVQ